MWIKQKHTYSLMLKEIISDQQFRLFWQKQAFSVQNDAASKGKS